MRMKTKNAQDGIVILLLAATVAGFTLTLLFSTADAAGIYKEVYRCGGGGDDTVRCADKTQYVHPTRNKTAKMGKPYCYNSWAWHYCEVYSVEEYDVFKRCCYDVNQRLDCK
jgi:hypothetical protein